MNLATKSNRRNGPCVGTKRKYTEIESNVADYYTLIRRNVWTSFEKSHQFQKQEKDHR